MASNTLNTSSETFREVCTAGDLKRWGCRSRAAPAGGAEVDLQSLSLEWLLFTVVNIYIYKTTLECLHSMSKNQSWSFLFSCQGWMWRVIWSLIFVFTFCLSFLFVCLLVIPGVKILGNQGAGLEPQTFWLTGCCTSFNVAVSPFLLSTATLVCVKNGCRGS